MLMERRATAHLVVLLSEKRRHIENRLAMDVSDIAAGDTASPGAESFAGGGGHKSMVTCGIVFTPVKTRAIVADTRHKPGTSTELPRGTPATGSIPWLPAIPRAASHAVIWSVVLVPTLVEMTRGWRPVQDLAGTAIGSFHTLTAHPPLVGLPSQASAGGSHTFFDLGPLLFWLLAIPVRIDPQQGALWGAALLFAAILSLAAEAAFSVGGWPACSAVAFVTADLGWQTELFTFPAANPNFGLVFLVAGVAFAWVVAAGHFGWWPLLVLVSSVAAQCHFVYVIPAVVLTLSAPLLALANRHRPVRSRWLISGLGVGVACWFAPAVEEVAGHPGNLSRLLGSGSGQPKAGIDFGFHAMSTAAAVRPLWLTQYPSLHSFLAMPAFVAQHSAAWGVISLGLVAGISLFAWRAKRSELFALAAVGMALSIGTAASLAFIPRDKLGVISYLGYCLWLLAVLLWIIVVWTGWEVVRSFLAWRGRVQIERRVLGEFGTGQMLGRVAMIAAVVLIVMAGLKAVQVQRAAADDGVMAFVEGQSKLDRTIARSVEASIARGPVTIILEQDSNGSRSSNPLVRLDDWGVSWRLLVDGWQPGLRGTRGDDVHLSAPIGALWPTVVVHVNLSSGTAVSSVVSWLAHGSRPG